MAATVPRADDGPSTYLVVDGENLDATLGNGVLGRRPAPEERPRWERVTRFVEQRWEQPVRPLFFINASSGTMPMPFIQALSALGIRVVPLSGPPSVKVVDLGIQKMLDAIADTDADVVLGSHDGDFLAQVDALLDGERRVGIVGFDEFLSAGYRPLVERGLELFDLERDVGAFNVVLPRLRIIPVEEFDPTEFL